MGIDLVGEADVGGGAILVREWGGGKWIWLLKLMSVMIVCVD